MSELENIFKRIETYRDQVIQLQLNLTARVALGPENGGTGEHEKTNYIKELLEALKPDILKEYKAPDERARHGYRPNLIAVWGDNNDAQPVTWVLSHSDIVPPGDPSLWESDPYKIRVEGDRIIGRGVEDNQHGFVSSYLALKAIIETGHEISRPVALAIVADEETGSKYGLQYLLDHHKELFKKEDIIIVPDVGNKDGTMIEVAEKSMLWLKFTVTGRQCHASTPGKGKNTLSGAAALILALDKLNRQFNSLDELFSPPVSTFAPTKAEANVPNINTIPGKNVFFMDCRILPEYAVDEVITACREISDKISRDLDLQIEVETAYRADAAEATPGDAPVVKALASAIEKVTGKQAEPRGVGGGTVAACFRKTGLPAAVWCTMPDTPHQPNEYCLIPNILTDAKIFSCLYLNKTS